MLVCAAGGHVSAHRLDEYLQAARVAIEPDRVELELDLTPGVAIADDVIAHIDSDRDGFLSLTEQRAYERAVLSSVHLELDGEPVRLVRTGSTFPDPDSMRRGEGTIRLQTSSAVPRQSGGAHRLFLRNAHRPDLGVYLANALLPSSERVAITAQHRDSGQRELAIDYVLQSPASLASAAWLLVTLAAIIGAATLLARPVRTT
jgi:hypothetical protein